MLIASAPRVLLISSLVILVCPAAEPRDFDVGVRGSLLLANGEPANDIPGFGVLARYAANERWMLAAALDLSEYDFEEPAKIAGIAQDPNVDAVDALAEATTVSIWAERALSPPGAARTWFVGAGLGAASVDVPDASGPRAGGGRFDVRTEVDTEIIAAVLGGVRRRFAQRWFVEFTLHAEQHFADWQVVDRVSGARGQVDDYLTYGGRLAIGVSW